MCTGVKFTDKNGNMYFGRNLDWSSDWGQGIVAIQRGFKHEKLLNNTIESKHAIIGVGILAGDFPLLFDAGNEAGLACGGLIFTGYADYTKDPVDGKTNVPSFALPLYLLSLYSTVDEVEAALKDIVITAEAFSPQFPPSELHWLIGDSKRTIVVEYTKTGMNIYDNPLDVLTNQPTFPYHLENVRSYMSLTPEFPNPVTWQKDTLTAYGSGSGMRGIPGDFYSPSRFIRAAYFNAHYPEQETDELNVLRLFRTLQGAAMILGGAKMSDGGFERTTYSDCFSASTMTYYYSTYDDPTIRKYELASVGADGGAAVAVPESK